MSELMRGIIFLLLFNLCLSKDSKEAAILEFFEKRLPEGGYKLRYLASDGRLSEDYKTVLIGGKRKLKIGTANSDSHDTKLHKKEKPRVSSSAIATLTGGGLG